MKDLFLGFIVAVIAITLIAYFLVYKTDQKAAGGGRCEANMVFCQSLIHVFSTKNGRLPDNLANLNVPTGKTACPVTHVEYGYLVITNDANINFVLFDRKPHDGGYTILTNGFQPTRVGAVYQFGAPLPGR